MNKTPEVNKQIKAALQKFERALKKISNTNGVFVSDVRISINVEVYIKNTSFQVCNDDLIKAFEIPMVFTIVHFI